MSVIALVIPTAGRRDVCEGLIRQLEDLEVPEGVSLLRVLSVPSLEDVPASARQLGWHLVVGARGLTAQRNKALEWLPTDTEYVVWLDDDLVPRGDVLSGVVSSFECAPDAVAVCGTMILDGVAERREISVEEAREVLVNSQLADELSASGRLEPTRELWGGFNAVRLEKAIGLRYDERLPLYSWLEDRDFACRLQERGRLVRSGAVVGVHRGVRSGGRQNHYRLGYAQVANPLWLLQKGSFSPALALVMLLKPVAKNIWFALRCRHPSNEWRRSRLAGNALALRDLVKNRGKSTPERIIEL